MNQAELPGNLSALETIREYAWKAAHAAGLSPKAAFGLQLAADELATNIVMHAYGGAGEEGTIVIRSMLSARSLQLILEDSGPVFDPTSFPAPTHLNDDLMDRLPGGLGIYLARRNVDEVRYERDGAINRLTLVVYLPG